MFFHVDVLLLKRYGTDLRLFRCIYKLFYCRKLMRTLFIMLAGALGIISEFPDHATFRENGLNNNWLD